MVYELSTNFSDTTLGRKTRLTPTAIVTKLLPHLEKKSQCASNQDHGDGDDGRDAEK